MREQRYSYHRTASKVVIWLLCHWWLIALALCGCLWLSYPFFFFFNLICQKLIFMWKRKYQIPFSIKCKQLFWLCVECIKKPPKSPHHFCNPFSCLKACVIKREEVASSFSVATTAIGSEKTSCRPMWLVPWQQQEFMFSYKGTLQPPLVCRGPFGRLFDFRAVQQ